MKLLFSTTTTTTVVFLSLQTHFVHTLVKQQAINSPNSNSSPTICTHAKKAKTSIVPTATTTTAPTTTTTTVITTTTKGVKEAYKI